MQAGDRYRGALRSRAGVRNIVSAWGNCDAARRGNRCKGDDGWTDRIVDFGGYGAVHPLLPWCRGRVPHPHFLSRGMDDSRGGKRGGVYLACEIADLWDELLYRGKRGRRRRDGEDSAEFLLECGEGFCCGLGQQRRAGLNSGT